MHCLIKDSEFGMIFKVLCRIKGIHKNCKLKLRNFIEAICYICRSGCQWRLLPKEYGCWRAIHKRFKYWSNLGIWKKIFTAVQINPDLEWVMIDSTIVRAHACAASFLQKWEALGRSKGGFTTKIHALTDALGNPLDFVLTPGQKNDITQAKTLMKSVSNSICLADKGYDADHFIKALERKNCIPVIPPRTNRKILRSYDKHLYKERSLIECFFSKIKQFRRIFSRYEKLAQSYLSFLYFVGALIWIR